MRHLSLLLIPLLGCVTTTPPVDVPLETTVSEPQSFYPETRRGDVVDDYHGTAVADPYRWLEDSEAPKVRAWITAQNEVTQDYLGRIEEREAIRSRMTELWNYERYSTPFREGDSWFWYHNDGLQNQSILYTGDAPDAEGRVLLDPNTFSEDGTVSLGGTWFSKDGATMAFAVSDGGSDWREIKVLEVATGTLHDDHLKHIKFSGATWAHDGSGFYYSRYPTSGDDMEALNEGQQLYFHTLGTEQSEDRLVYERPEHPRWGFGAGITEDGRWLTISQWEGTARKNRVFIQDLKDPKGGIQPLLTEFDARYRVLGNDGETLYIETDKDAPRGRVISLKVSAPDARKELVPEGEYTLKRAGIAGGDKLLLSTLEDAHDVIRVHSLDGGFIRNLELPGLGSASLSWSERSDQTLFFSYTSYTTPGSVYTHDLESGETELFRAAAVSMDEDAYTVQQAFYPSKDGTQIPMYLVHRKDLALDGTNPTYLYGYGGFNVSLTPRYSTVDRVWLEMGGVLAVANLRGGGEYGKAWHDAGKLKNKQNVFDDFHAAAEWLIANNYTQSDALAIGGRSNGGLLVGAAITQRPELYGAALPGVGVLDMLRYNQFTIGWAWESDYGSSTDPEMFPVLYAYSPYHNVTPQVSYPPTLVTTGDHDDRVVPGHSFKFAAALQHAQSGSDPVLIRIETRAGHGGGKPTDMRIAEWTDQWAFLVQTLDMPLPEDFGAATTLEN